MRRMLALEFVLIAGAIHLVLIILIVGIREGQLRQQFDADLFRRADRIAGAAAQDVMPPEAVVGAVNAEVLSAGMTPLLAQARGPDGELLGSTGGFNGAVFPLPFDLEEMPPAGTYVYATIDGAAVGRPGEPFRVLTLVEEGPPAYLLQTAVTFQPVAASIASLRRLLFVLALPGAMVGTGIAAWLISGHVARRIDEVARAAQRVSASQAHPRLEVPAHRDEIGGMVVEMNSMLARIESAFRAQERFIVDVTHELKTPVSVMLAEAQVLKKSSSATVDRYREFVVSVEEEMRRLGSLLESFLTLARSGHGQRYIAESLVDLTDVALDAIQRCEGAARERKVNVEFLLPADGETGIAVRGDAELLTTLVANLVRNAADETPSGHSVEVGVTPGPGEVRVVVSHPVPGGAADTSSPRYRSRELAFDVARGIAELHGGEISTTRGPRTAEASLRLPTVSAA
jgi:signal transduction histidine kinase